MQVPIEVLLSYLYRSLKTLLWLLLLLSAVPLNVSDFSTAITLNSFLLLERCILSFFHFFLSQTWFSGVKLHGFLIALIVSWLVIELGSPLRCVLFLFQISLQSAFIQLVVQLNNHIHKFAKNIDLIFRDCIIFIAYDLVFNFFLESLPIHVLEDLIILSNITGVLGKLR